MNSLESIPQAFFAIAEREPDRTVYRQSNREGSAFFVRSYSEVRTRISKLSNYFKKIGVIHGRAVAIISNTRPEWMEADIAILAAGGVVISVYQSLTPQDIGYILHDAQADIVVVENEEQLEKIRYLETHDIVIPAVEDRPQKQVRLAFSGILAFESTTLHPLVTSLEHVLSTGDDRCSIAPLKLSDIASLVYTSGTTGPAKGVVQTHGNHLANVRQAREADIYQESSSIFLLLPLAHSFAKLMGYIGFLRGAELVFPAVSNPKSSKPDPELVMRDLARSGSTVIPIVPRLLEKMREGIVEKGRGNSLKAKILTTTLRVATQRGIALRAKQQVPLLVSLLYRITGGIRAKISKALFGTRFLYAISGGAKLPVPVADFFSDIGIEILEGYGLTETCVATNVNRSGKNCIGTVGPVLSQDIEVRIAEDGEILFRGPNVARGYYQRPQATAQAWDSDGWFHTGDLGLIDEAQRLIINGRKKELIVTSGGKKIPPEAIEIQLKTVPLVSQALLVGDGRQYCVALLTLVPTAVQQWLRETGSDALDEQLQRTKIEAYLMSEVEKINARLASFETVKKIAVVPDEFTIDNGMLTPTFKVKRSVVEKRYREVIEGLYPSTL
jgi:long-chain acyl-CoA synthetase